MRAIIVDDGSGMLHFVQLCAKIPDLTIAEMFICAEKALDYASENPVNAVFLGITTPDTGGIELAEKLRRICPDILIVFISDSSKYVRDFNRIGGDYYILKPCGLEVLERAMERLRLLSRRQCRELYVQTFGGFLVLRNGRPLPLAGKAKEVLALVVIRRGKEISNKEIYSTIWEGRPYSNKHMSVYYNVLRRLKEILKMKGVEDLLISTKSGQMIKTDMFDCDYYDWLAQRPGNRGKPRNNFLPQYTWAKDMA